MTCVLEKVEPDLPKSELKSVILLGHQMQTRESCERYLSVWCVIDQFFKSK